MDSGLRVNRLVDELTLDEKAALTAGADFWSTVPIERLGIPAVTVTDGPNGARGRSFGSTGPTAACVPCGSGLAATWDSAVIERIGGLLGRQARSKSARVLLAPTVNIHRSPLAGRNFECFSEDPMLSGRIGAAYVRGAQAEGVACTVKHLVGNEAEFERNTISSEIDERTLREIYLAPFETVVREGGALGVMTAYNRLNGRYCTEQRWLLDGLLRDEWGFDGFVLTDWFALADTVDSASAGLDLEMPGPPRVFGPALADAVRSGALAEQQLDRQVHNLLSVFDRIGALDDGADRTEHAVDLPADRSLTREVAAAGMVLLRNDGLLPLRTHELRRVALIGPNAAALTIMGGGSAALRSHPVETLEAAMRQALGGDVEIVVERGCAPKDAGRPVFVGRLIDLDGQDGVSVDVYDGPDLEGEPHVRLHADDANLVFLGPPSETITSATWSFRASGWFTPDETGEHVLSLVQTSATRVFVDGELVLDAWSDAPSYEEGPAGIQLGRAQTTIALRAGDAIRIVIEHTNRDSNGSIDVSGVGASPPVAADLLDTAVRAARSADVAVVVVGTTSEDESEGTDRSSLALPAGQDELVRAVLSANPRTVVVVNAGAPVTMEWADEVPALLYAWFGGQEMPGALADVLVGRSEPGGRLPMTIPLDVRHNPAFGNFPGENGEVRYGEGLLVGYRWYEARRLPVRFPFGHGLSYTRFSMGTPVVANGLRDDGHVRIDVTVTNTGTCAGSEVVQCYVAARAPRLMRPPKELRAFAKVALGANETATVTLTLDRRAFAYWDDGYPAHDVLCQRLGERHAELSSAGWQSESGWRVDPGTYELHIGRSSADIAHVVTLDL